MLDYLPLPLSFFVRSEIRYVEPGVGVGGSGFPRTPVTSSPVRPPLGPTRSYFRMPVPSGQISVPWQLLARATVRFLAAT
jgi:hypothetical protein